MRVGLSILSHAGQSVWNNGIGQNVLFLADLLSAIAFVREVVLIDCGDQKALPGDAPSGYRVAGLAEADGVLDVAIEMAGGLDPVWLARQRARGTKVVWHICGQPYASLVEPALFGKPGYWSDPHRADEIWLLPKDAGFASMLRALCRRPVHVTPYLWSPRLLDALAARLAEDGGGAFGYRPGSLGAGVRAAVFEPNISPIKTCLLAMLACDMAAREAPGAIERLTLYNAAHLRGRPTFDYALKSLTLESEGKVETRERDYFARAMTGANMVVSHQLECPQNYLYPDALHGDYPLAHNSPLFSDVGYYYPGEDAAAGGQAILRALREHDRNLEDYRRRSRRMLDRLSPDNRDNGDAYARRLLDLTARKAPAP